MSLLMLVLFLVIAGVFMWAILQLPIAPQIKNIILVVVVVFMLIWVLQQFGLIHGNLRLF